MRYPVLVTTDLAEFQILQAGPYEVRYSSPNNLRKDFAAGRQEIVNVMQTHSKRSSRTVLHRAYAARRCSILTLAPVEDLRVMMIRTL